MKHRWTVFPAVALVAAVLFAVVAGNSSPKLGAPKLAVANTCRFQSAPAGTAPAFCDDFSGPASNTGRSPALPSVWGVSRMPGISNFGQGQFNAQNPTTLTDACGTVSNIYSPSDVRICNGQVSEAVTDGQGVDNGTVAALAMYPKQPFDIAGRTGTIAFDVSNDSHGNHRAWPEVWYTDTPQPVPFDHFSSKQSVPKDGFGVRFAGSCPANQADCRTNCPSIAASSPVFTVDSADVVNNYVSDDSFMDGTFSGPIVVTKVGCVKASSGPGNMNHIELRVSAHEIDVWATDAGNVTGPMTELATITNMSLSLTRGLVWMEDVHYNGNKDGIDQGTHTFTWDNVGFDGPALPQDLAFDAPDALTQVGTSNLRNLGAPVGPNYNSNLLSVSVPGVSGIANAAGALLTYNTFSYAKVDVSYRVNSGAWQTKAWPFGDPFGVCASGICGDHTIAVPVPLADLVAGTNSVQFKSTDSTAIFNVDLILQGAAGSTAPPPTTTTAPPTTMAPTTTAPPAAATKLTCPVVVNPTVGQQITCTYA